MMQSPKPLSSAPIRYAAIEHLDFAIAEFQDMKDAAWAGCAHWGVGGY